MNNDPSLDPSSDPGSNPGSDPCSDPSTDPIISKPSVRTAIYAALLKRLAVVYRHMIV